MREIVHYEAFDGSLFDTKKKCVEYEANSIEKIDEDFRKLVVRCSEGCKITDDSNAFPLAEVAEGWWYGIIVMKDEHDYEVVRKYANMKFGNKKIPKIFNKEIIVVLGDGDSNTCEYNFFYYWGTVEDAVEKYKEALMTFGK